MIDTTIIDLMLLVTAVDDKIWHIQQDLDSTDEDDPMYGYDKEEQARYITLGQSSSEVIWTPLRRTRHCKTMAH